MTARRAASRFSRRRCNDLIDPVHAFLEGREQAKAHQDPNAHLCFLATTENGQAANRVMMLHDDYPLTLFLNRSSPTYRQLRTGDYEVLTYWPSIGSQFRLRGDHEELSAEQMAPIWAERDYDAKIRNLYYDRYAAQSTPVVDARTVQNAYAKLRASFAAASSPAPGMSWASGSCRTGSNGGWEGEQVDWGRYLYTLEQGVWSRRALVF